MNFQIPDYILSDLCTRFIINIPGVEGEDVIRVFFQIELAHWFYLDFYCTDNNELKTCSIKEFAAQIFKFCPTLSKYHGNFEYILELWKEYKQAVPTYGAILLDASLQFCLLVQGYWVKASWSFPKGKVNQDERPVDCAIREVLEETGFDIGSMIDANNYLENRVGEQVSRLYIIPGVPKDTVFQAKTRQEIKGFSWFNINYLPSHKKDSNLCRAHYNLNPNAFFMVIPFINDLRTSISQMIACSNRQFGDKVFYNSSSPRINYNSWQKSTESYPTKHKSDKNLLHEFSPKNNEKSEQLSILDKRQIFHTQTMHDFLNEYHLRDTKNYQKLFEKSKIKSSNLKSNKYDQVSSQSYGKPLRSKSANENIRTDSIPQSKLNSEFSCPLWADFHLDLNQIFAAMNTNVKVK